MQGLIKIEKPQLPENWNYDESVSFVKQTLYKWKNLTGDMATELWIARTKLSKPGKRTDLTPEQKFRGWTQYCNDIGSQVQIVNRWIDQWFPNEKKSLKESNIIEDVSEIINEYDSNMFIVPQYFTDRGFGDEYIVDDYNNIRTITTQSKFFHKNGKEFSLREYANYQDFPSAYKFIGSYQTIKKQIGNAVSPMMGKYITKDLKGKIFGDLFAGCGGFGCGAEQNGLEGKWAIEWDKTIAMSYKINFPNAEVYNVDIRSFDPRDLEPVDIIIGSPPCQGFSSAKGYVFKDDPRNELYKEFVRFIDVLKPNEFIMENVPEIEDISEQIIDDFNNCGYVVTTILVRGKDIGMRQNRKRFFFKGKKYE